MVQQQFRSRRARIIAEYRVDEKIRCSRCRNCIVRVTDNDYQFFCELTSDFLFTYDDHNVKVNHIVDCTAFELDD